MMEFRNQILETLEIVSEAGALAAMARGPQGRVTIPRQSRGLLEDEPLKAAVGVTGAAPLKK